MIESSPLPPDPPSAPLPRPEEDPILLEDLAAILRLLPLWRKLDRILAAVVENFRFPEDSPFRLLSETPSDQRVEYGLRWGEPKGLLQVFAGMSWGDLGHDPLWEVRVEAGSRLDPAPLRLADFPRLAARRADSRFTEWDRFWHEEPARSRYLFGCSAACTRFLEEPDPDRTAAEYLAGALNAIHYSGSLLALLEAAAADPSAS